MRRIAMRWPAASGAVLMALLSIAPAPAQQPAPAQRPPPLPAPLPKAAAPRDGAQTSELALRQRIEQLEEQLVDMQVVVGTLESLARGAPAPMGAASSGARPNAGAAAALNAADAGRLDSLETQIQALTAQLENLQEQVRAVLGRSGAVAPSSSLASAEPIAKPGRPGDGAAPPPGRTGFGAVKVSPGSGVQRDDIDQLLTAPAAPPLAGVPAGGASAAAAPTVAALPETDVAPKQLYETAYGYLLQRDYGAAEAAFEDFLQRFPSDPLAGNAQYWLGESLYVRGQYRSAAGAFLKGYQTYGRNAKAPESLLRLAMSLQRLGQKDAACSSFNELASKYPSAPPHVKTSAQAERQKAGC